MRFRPLLAVLLVLSLVAACGGDDDDDGAAATDDTELEADDETTTTTEDEGDDETDEPADDPELQAAIETTQLEAADLGDGWELTSTTPPSDEDDDEPNPLEDCIGGDLGDRFDAAQVAETEERTFELQGDAPIPLQLTSSSAALDDGDLFEEMHAVLRDATFGECMGAAFEELMASTTPEGTEIVIGDIVQADTVVDPGDDADLASTGISIPVTITAQGFTVETSVSILFINTGQLGASLLFFGPVEELSAEQQAEFGRIVAERLSAAA